MSATQPFRPAGLLLTALRRRMKVTRDRLAKDTDTSSSHMRHVLSGRYGASRELIAKICAVLCASREEEAEVQRVAEELRQQNARPHAAKVERQEERRFRRLALAICNGTCTHDGEMARHDSTTGRLGRDDECVHYSACLRVFTISQPNAEECHCPPACSKREHVDPKAANERRIAEATSGGTWAWERFPSGLGERGPRRKVA